MLYVQFSAPGGGLKNRPKHVQHFTEINKLSNVASCWLYFGNMLAMHGPMNVKFFPEFLNSGPPLSERHSRIPIIPPSAEDKKHIQSKDMNILSSVFTNHNLHSLN